MEIWFAMQMARKISIKINQSPGKITVMYLPHGLSFFQERSGILDPPLYGYEM